MKKRYYGIVAVIISFCLLAGCAMTAPTSAMLDNTGISKDLPSSEPTDPVKASPTLKPSNTDVPSPTSAAEPTSEPEPTNTPTPEVKLTNTPTPKPTATNTPTPKPTATNVPTPEPTKAGGTGQQSGGNGDNFNKYNNEDQQKTEAAWVLNNNTMKIHYPSCNDVKKIKPDNYATSDLSLEELLKQGYTRCGHCFR